MKVVILAGGFGTRLEEITVVTPKPLVLIGDKPILWHIMKIYSHYGYNEFIICLGYKGYDIKDYFANYFLHNFNISFDFTSGNDFNVLNAKTEPWKVTLIDTGLYTRTGGRIKRVQSYIEPDETFMLTYGDGVSDIDINKLVDFHFKQKKHATISAVYPPGKFGTLELNDHYHVINFNEKPSIESRLINGGFMVLNKEIFKYLKDGDETIWERDPLETLSRTNNLAAYIHKGFWKCMDTQREKKELIDLWESGNPPWKIWKD